MEIVLTTPLYPPEIGGPSTYTKNVEREMKKRGHVVRVVKFSDVRSFPTGIRHMIFFIKTLRAIRGADVVFAQDVFSVGLPTALACKLLGKRFFVRVPGDFAWEQGVQRFGVKDSIDNFQKNKYGFRVELFRTIQKFIVRSAEKVVVPSTYFKHLVSGWLRDSEKVVRIYNGLEEIGGIEKKQFPQKTIVTAGRLVPWKGFDKLIMFMQNTEYNLVIIGSGPEKQNLEYLISSLNLEQRVSLVDSLEKKELLSYLHGAYAFILPSTFESFSFQLVEALSVGTPSIAFDIGNLSEIITNGENGFLVPENDWGAVQKSLDVIEKERFTISSKAIASSKNFSIENTVNALEKEFNIKNRVLMISTDSKSFNKDSSVFKRFKDYAQKLDSLDVVVLSTSGFSKISEGNLTIHPTNSKNKLKRIWKAVSISRKIKHIRTITSQDPFEIGFVACLLSRGKKYQAQIHTDLFNIHFIKNPINFARVFFGFFVLVRANSIRVVSERIKNSLPGVFKNKKVDILPIYTNLEHQQKTIELSDPHYLLTVSRLEKEKNVDVLIRMMPYLKNTVLHIVGSGSLQTKLEKLAQDLNVQDMVVFHGFDSDTEKYYKKADVYVQASSYEGFGLSLLEAASFGVPIVSTNVGLVQCELEEGVTVAKQQDAKDFAQKVNFLLADDQARLRVSQKLFKYSQSLKISYEEYIDSYIKMLG